MIIYDQFVTIQNLQRALMPQTSNWAGTIFGRFLQQTGSSEHGPNGYVRKIVWKNRQNFHS